MYRRCPKASPRVGGRLGTRRLAKRVEAPGAGGEGRSGVWSERGGEDGEAGGFRWAQCGTFGASAAAGKDGAGDGLRPYPEESCLVVLEFAPHTLRSAMSKLIPPRQQRIFTFPPLDLDPALLISTHDHSNMSGRPSFAQLAQKLMQQRAAQAGFGGAGKSGGAGGKGPNLGQAVGGGAGVILLAVAGLTVNASMFNGAWWWRAETGEDRELMYAGRFCAVDGGHRAIKYTRLNGVSDTVYSEGTHLMVSACGRWRGKIAGELAEAGLSRSTMER